MKQHIREAVYKYKTKHVEGFLDEEIKDLLKKYPKINMDKFEDALMGVTCHVDENNKAIIYHCDVETALRCGLENRNMYEHEFD